MKKILMTSGAALLLSAGYAAADTISFAGDGRMGVVYDKNADENNFRIDSRVRGYFFFDAETDTGLAFGGRLRIQDAAVTGGGGTASGFNHVYVESDFGRLMVGDVGSAAQSAVGDLSGVGFTGHNFRNETDFLQRNFNGGFFGTQSNKALYSYDLDAFSIYASTGPIDGAADVYSVGASYDAGMFAVGAGFEYADGPAFFEDETTTFTVIDEDGEEREFERTESVAQFNGTATHLTGSVEANLEQFSVKGTVGYAGSDLGTYLEGENLNKWQAGLGASSSFDQISVTAYGRQDFFKDRHFGVGASYDLGGGARLDAGIEHTRYNMTTARGDDSDTFADLGVNMSF